MLYALLIQPIQLIIEYIYALAYSVTNNSWRSLLMLCVIVSILLIPVYRRIEDKPYLFLAVEIPHFLASYFFVSSLTVIKKVTFGPIKDLGLPDNLLHIGTASINLLPIALAIICLSFCIVVSQEYKTGVKIAHYVLATILIVFLYQAPSGLVLYWMLFSILSIIRFVFFKLFKVKQKKEDISFLKNKKIFEKLSLTKKTNDKASWVFLISCCVYLSLLVGFSIPSGVIQSSPQEFVNVYHYMNPLWFVASSTLIALGLFSVWTIFLYALMIDVQKKIFRGLIFALCLVSTVDYMFFAKDMGILDRTLRYTDVFAFSVQDKIINLLIVIVVAVVAFIAYLFLDSKLMVLTLAEIATTLAMSSVNCVKANAEVIKLLPTVEKIKEGEPTWNLSRNGKNVIVFMLDRAWGEYVPYFLNEKPELAEIYDGFTYYHNTVSFGAYTNMASPALFGGYEYTPEEINKRKDKPLAQEQNEALKMMPILFSEEGYDVTVCDPPEAGYDWTPNLAIYDDHPEINTYITKGYYWNMEKSSGSNSNFRNLFCYAIMKVSPLFIQVHLYDNGFYNETLSVATKGMNAQLVEATGQKPSDDCLRAEGINDSTMEDYMTLVRLNEMTNIVDDNSNNFLMIDNDTTHSPSLFQEPEYDLSYFIDNTDYEHENIDRYTFDGITLAVENGPQYVSYQTNMAALLRVGEWLEYLKREGVYDNTRIIIVSDHGRNLRHNSCFYLDNGEDDLMDLEFFFPLLMVKDFDAHGFTVSEELMTNADVPSFALGGIVENPKNPFSGKPINMEPKNNQPLHILSSDRFDTMTYNGNTFDCGLWLTVEKEVHDKNNWTILRDERW